MMNAAKTTTARTLFRGGQIASEDSPFLQSADVLVEGEKLVGVGENLTVEGPVEEIDCTGCVLMPAMFDLHVHAREPGQEQKESIESASEAAINGGVTGMVLMPNTLPAIDSGGLVQTIKDIAEEKSRIQVLQSGCLTKGRAGEELSAIAGLAAKGVPLLTDDGDAVADPRLLRRAMEYAKDFGLPVASHCEVKALSGKGAINEGKISYRLGLPGIPSISEEICIDRDIRLAQYTGAHLHIQHVTTARGMETIRRAKEDGVNVTCEVAPHHLIFNEGDIRDYDPNFKMNPPLRSEEDNELLLQGLIGGVIDVIATDHAPHTEFEKRNCDFASAPFGITGLETAVVSLFHHFIKQERFGWDLVVRRYSAEPRRLLGLEPFPVVEEGRAEFLVFATDQSTTFQREFMRSKSANTPFVDQTLEGRVVAVVRGGEILLQR